MPPEKETFLVVRTSTFPDLVDVFVFQGTYEELYRIDHRIANLHFYLIAPDPTQEARAEGQPLIKVGDNLSMHRADHLIGTALWHLRRLPIDQQKREIAMVQERLQKETTDLLVREDPVKALGIKTLTDEEINQLRRK